MESFQRKFKGLYLEIFLLLVLISGLVLLILALISHTLRLNLRDAVRSQDINTIMAALETYFKDSPTGYSASTGECLTADSGVGAELEASGVLAKLPLDPLWPKALPGSIFLKSAKNSPVNFCYYYTSLTSDKYMISFFLESDSGAGRVGFHTVTKEKMVD